MKVFPFPRSIHYRPRLKVPPFQFFRHCATFEFFSGAVDEYLLFLSLRYGADLGRSRLVWCSCSYFVLDPILRFIINGSSKPDRLNSGFSLFLIFKRRQRCDNQDSNQQVNVHYDRSKIWTF